VQRALLELAALHLAPNGTITYATCTLRPEENEHVVEGFLRDRPEFHLEPIPVDSRLRDERGFLRTFPHRHGTDGFFAALLRYAGSPG
jgi:16S rRNA (cytosine967-C5)-methyltransferase